MSSSILLELTRRYLEPHRHYHTLEHIAHMLEGTAVAARSEGHALADEQILAVWFHDAVYDPRASDNEEKSAALAAAMLRAEGKDESFFGRVERIVLDTKHHVPSIALSQAVIDADLQTLALPWEGYLKIGALIRREYAFVDDAQWRQGRARFFSQWLQRERIYYTPWGRQLESQARSNLARTVAGEA